MTPTELILIKFIEQHGWEVSKTLTFDNHQWFTATNKEEKPTTVKGDTITTLFHNWTEHPFVLTKVLNINVTELTEEQARKEQQP